MRGGRVLVVGALLAVGCASRPELVTSRAADASTTTTTTTTTTSTTTTTPTTTTTAPPTTTTTAPPPPTPVEDPMAPLRLRAFRSTEVTESGEPRPLVDGTDLEVWFQYSKLAVPEHPDVMASNAGCPSSGSNVTSIDQRLVAVGGGWSISIECEDPEIEAQQAWFSAFLHDEPMWALHDGTLTLTVADTVIVLQEEAFPTDP